MEASSNQLVCLPLQLTVTVTYCHRFTRCHSALLGLPAAWPPRCLQKHDICAGLLF